MIKRQLKYKHKPNAILHLSMVRSGWNKWAPFGKYRNPHGLQSGLQIGRGVELCKLEAACAMRMLQSEYRMMHELPSRERIRSIFEDDDGFDFGQSPGDLDYAFIFEVPVMTL